MHCWGGGAAQTASSGMADDSYVTKINHFCNGYGIPARMFNGVRVSLEGKVASVREQQKFCSDSLVRQIASADRVIAEVAGRGLWDQVHQNRRRLANLRDRLVRLEADVAAGRVRLCLDSKS